MEPSFVRTSPVCRLLSPEASDAALRACTFWFRRCSAPAQTNHDAQHQASIQYSRALEEFVNVISPIYHFAVMLRSSLRPCCFWIRINGLRRTGDTRLSGRRAASSNALPEEDKKETFSDLNIIKHRNWQRSKEIYSSPAATLGHYGVVTTTNASATVGTLLSCMLGPTDS